MSNQKCSFLLSDGNLLTHPGAFFAFWADLYTLLLEDILVLLQKQDDKLVLKCHSKILASTADSKHTFSPIIKLNTVLVRQVATGQCSPLRKQEEKPKIKISSVEEDDFV